jgi:hypothetical protein
MQKNLITGVKSKFMLFFHFRLLASKTIALCTLENAGSIQVLNRQWASNDFIAKYIYCNRYFSKSACLRHIPSPVCQHPVQIINKIILKRYKFFKKQCCGSGISFFRIPDLGSLRNLNWLQTMASLNVHLIGSSALNPTGRLRA